MRQKNAMKPWSVSFPATAIQPSALFRLASGVDKRMRVSLAWYLLALTARVATQGVRFIETPFTSNAASQALFVKAFHQLGIPHNTSVLFSHQQHFAGLHEDEVLYRAGPLPLDSDKK